MADITTDGTVGPAGPLAGPNFVIPNTLGTQVGGNLFHSFSDFNINTGESATFTSDFAGVTNNVISRVTGVSPSTINGELKSQISGADFWFINPSGVLFGPEARLSLLASVHVSTADYLTLGNCGATPTTCGRFNATGPDTSTLTVASPVSFGFLDTVSGPLQVDGARLGVAFAETLSLIGADVTATDARLSARAGTLQMTSVAGAGEIPVLLADRGPVSAVTLGPLSLSNTIVDTGGQEPLFPSGGRIFIRGGVVTLEDASQLSSDHFGAAMGGGITIEGTDSIVLSSGTNIAIQNNGTGSAGSISLRSSEISLSGGSNINQTGLPGKPGDVTIEATGTLTIDGAGAGGTGIKSLVPLGTSVDAGSVAIQAGNSVSLLSGGEISSTTQGAGNAGELAVTTSTLQIDGSNAPGQFTGISSQSTLGASGDAGTVTVYGDYITIIANGEISSNTFSTGAAGEISVDGDTIVIDGMDGAAIGFTGISSGSQTGATGDAGAVSVHGDSVTIRGGGQVSSSTSGSGAGGQVTLTGGAILIDGNGAPVGATGITSASKGFGTDAGKAGNVAVTAGTVTLDQGGQFAATTVDGAGGAVTLTADTIEINSGAQLNVATSGSGNAGDVQVLGLGSTTGNITRSKSVTMSGPGSGINSNTSGTGDGGAVAVVTSSLEASRGAAISAASAPTSGPRLGNAGSILADATDLKLSSGGTIATTSATSGGGSIEVRSTGNVLLYEGAITASAQGVQADDSGGNVTISRPQFVVLNRGEIRADANAGRGGNILIDTNAYVASADSIVSASSEQNVDGQITNTAANTVADPVDLPAPDPTPPEPIRSRCLPEKIKNRSSLIVRQVRPGELRSPYPPSKIAADGVAMASEPCG